MITVLFAFCAAIGIAIAYTSKMYFSGHNFKRWIFCCSVFLNLFAAAFHMKLAEQSCVMFYGCFPQWHEQHPALVWIALASMLLHLFAFPVEWQPKCWFRKKRARGVEL